MAPGAMAANIANIERDLPPTAIELRGLSEALDMQAQLLGELHARLQVISVPNGSPQTANGQAAPPRSSMTEAIHGLRCRVMDHNESLRNMIAGLEI